jgi:hypothetical protein
LMGKTWVERARRFPVTASLRHDSASDYWDGRDGKFLTGDRRFWRECARRGLAK